MAQTIVNDSRVYKLVNTDDGPEAPNIISIDAGTIATVAIDWGPLLNPGTGIATFSLPAIASGSVFATAIAANVVSDDKRHTTFTVTAASDEAGERKLTFTVTTTDSQTLLAQGYLHVM